MITSGNDIQHQVKVIFLTPYPHETAPSQRFRFEQYLTLMEAHGISYRQESFIDMATWDILYKKGMLWQKAFGILKGFLHRFLLLFSLGKYDFVFIHREASPLGPPIFEWIIARILQKKIIYDYDDAIWLPLTSANNKIIGGLKWHGKVKQICRWAHKVSCGNSYLATYARQYNSNVIVNPTTIDTMHYHTGVKDQHTHHLTIGWTGTHSTAQYLDIIVPILEKLEQKFDFTFMVISNSKPAFHLRSLQYVHWSKEQEIDDLMKFNIGIMPLTDDEWAKGKCGFKALQYMSLGIPALVSPVGVNTEIVANGVDGLICATPTAWEAGLSAMIQDADLRIKMGVAARKKIAEHYSVLSNTNNFLSLFKN